MTNLWQTYQRETGETIRQQWAERQLILTWLGFVQSQGDYDYGYTIECLTDWLRLGNWTRAAVEDARELARLIGAEQLD